MSQNKVKSITVEYESLSPSNSNVEPIKMFKERKAAELDSDPKLPFVDRSRTNIEAGQAFAKVFGIPSSDNRSLSSKMGNGLPPWMSSQMKCHLIRIFKKMHGRSRSSQKAYVVRVADEDEWGVAAKMDLEKSMNPMSELFGEKHERARMAAQFFSKSKRAKFHHQCMVSTEANFKHIHTYVYATTTFFPPNW
ncbi:43172_t:CDS:2 [Gigaspora margarita]|uniref:43172_t:CDS:1 n=1 Tax=Gigaspora margarita TaxID=4874 RepID=A0ABM8W6K7_GIGMA|nr:43172_t:CDS:2 [Gigaspora margarita]